MKQLHYHSRGLLFLGIGILFAIFLSQSQLFQYFMISLESYGYLGAFIAGALFVSTLTVATGAFMLITLSHSMPPLWLSIFAGIGATCGNYLIFLFIKDHFLHQHSMHRKKGRVEHHHKQWAKHGHWLLPFLGVVILASPLPDELGILFLSIYRMKPYQFVAISFLLKVGGIFLLVTNLPRLL